MVLMTILFRSDWKWSSICYLISGIVLALNIPVLFIHREPRTQQVHPHSAVSPEQYLEPKQHYVYSKGETRKFADFLSKPIFYVLLLLSMTISVVRINTSFISW
jgi:hypothetical protein